jgi:4'-phosphopantetheinyl transferase
MSRNRGTAEPGTLFRFGGRAGGGRGLGNRMRAPIAKQTLPEPLFELVSFAHPAPGYRLSFVSIPLFLESCLVKRVPVAYRTSPPQAFAHRDFSRGFLSADELTRVNGFKALKKQVEWMAGRFAAKALAGQFLGGRPVPDQVEVGYRPKGAPFFTMAPALSLSLSHSQDYAVAGLGRAPARTLGVDLEVIRPASRRLLLKTAFSEQEAADLRHRDDETLFKRWTAKEAYLKYIGQGFHENLKRIEIFDDTIYHHGRAVTDVALHSDLPFPGYAFSIVWRR